MKTTLAILGAGSALSATYDNSSFLFSFGEGESTTRYLFDCGITTPKIWKRALAGIPLDGIMVTHTHADHCGGIEELAFQHKYRIGKKLQLFTQPDVWERLWNTVLRGGLGGSSENPADFFDLRIGELPREFSDAEWFRMQHVSPNFPNYGAAFQIQDFLLWISGDCAFHAKMFERQQWEARFGRPLPDLIFHEVAFYDDGSNTHTTYKYLKSLPSAIKERMMLYHYDEQVLDITKDGFRGYVEASDLKAGEALLRF